MKIKSLILLVCAFFLVVSPLCAENNPFKVNNPNGVKYEFARSFIASMSYFESVDKRQREAGVPKNASDEKNIQKWNLDRLAKDNLDLLVAKNYMVKYFNAGNALIRKVVDMYAVACDELVALNHRERELWLQWPKMQGRDEQGNIELGEFRDAQAVLSDERKTALRKIVETAVLMTKVLLNEDVREKQVRYRLALTQNQREKLIRKLDDFAGDNLDWGMKPGQTYLQSAQAVVREVLEDPTYLNVDE